jgi:SPW repeat-containing protein
MKRNQAIGDVLNLILAVWLFLSPWIVGFAGLMPAAWTAWLSAIAIAIFAIAALSAFAEWEEWINLILGVWVLISPWIVRVSAERNPTVVLFLTGLVVAIIAAVELWMQHRAPSRMTTA